MKKLAAILLACIFWATATPAFAAECIATPARTVTTQHKAVTHAETRWTKEVPAVEEVIEYQFKRVVPGVDAVTHKEWRMVIENSGVVGVPEFEFSRCVNDKKTQYHFAKFTQTREGTKKASKEIIWGEYGEWTKWEPEQHTSWEDSKEPLGSPEFHGSGKKGNVYWERVWQAQWDGTTREVDAGTQTCETKWALSNPGEGWVRTDTPERWNVEPVDPFKEYATKDGRTTDVIKAAYFTEAEIATFSRGWKKFGDPKVVEDSAAIPAKSLYKTAEGETDVKADAGWFLNSDFDNWTQFNSKVAVSAEPAYSVYYVSGGEPTLELGNTNWTTDTPKGWTFVDERKVTDRDAYTTEKDIPATYEECLAETGANGNYLPWAALLAFSGVLCVALSRRKA